MNLISVIIGIIVAGIIIAAAVKTIKNRGKCSCGSCGGNCECCKKLL